MDELNPQEAEAAIPIEYIELLQVRELMKRARLIRIWDTHTQTASIAYGKLWLEEIARGRGSEFNCEVFNITLPRVDIHEPQRRAALEELLDGLVGEGTGIPTDAPTALVFEIDSRNSSLEYLAAAIQVIKGSDFDVNLA